LDAAVLPHRVDLATVGPGSARGDEERVPEAPDVVEYEPAVGVAGRRQPGELGQVRAVAVESHDAVVGGVAVDAVGPELVRRHRAAHLLAALVERGERPGVAAVGIGGFDLAVVLGVPEPLATGPRRLPE